MKFLKKNMNKNKKYNDVKDFYTILENIVKEVMDEDGSFISPFFKPTKEWFEKIENEREVLSEAFPELMTYQQGKKIKKKFLYEGLIKTFSKDETKNVLKNVASLGEDDFYYHEKENTFSIFFESKNRLADNQIDLIFMSLNNTLNVMNAAGWFISTIYDVNVQNNIITSNKKIISNIPEKNKEIIDIILDCEYAQINYQARYSQELDKEQYPKFAFHITSNLFIDKILKIGLTPKTKSKKATHPSRIYLAQNYDDVLKLGGELYEKEIEAQKTFDKKDKINKLLILKIDLNDFSGRLFKDDMAIRGENFDEDSIWTNDNISPERIQIFSEFNIE